MEPKRRAKFSSSKEAYCAWYRFALIALDAKDPEIRAAMKKSRGFYKPWHLDRRADPEDWWETHSFLFEETQEVRVLKVGEKPRVPDALIIEVPLTLSPTRLKEAVGELIIKEMWRRDWHGMYYSHSMWKSSAAYKLPPGAWIRPQQIEEIRFFLVACLENPELKGERLLKKVVQAYKKNKKRIPAAFVYDEDDADRIKNVVLRTMRKKYCRAMNILRSVANGAFPGGRGYR